MHAWRASDETTENLTHCSRSRDVYRLERPGAREALNLERTDEGAALLASLLPQLQQLQQRWRPPPAERNPNPLKYHYVVYPDTRHAANGHVCFAVQCTKQRCTALNASTRRTGAWWDGGNGAKV